MACLPRWPMVIARWGQDRGGLALGEVGLCEADLVDRGELLGLGEVDFSLFLGGGVLCLGEEFGDPFEHGSLLSVVGW